MIKASVRKAILRDLPAGESLRYFGPTKIPSLFGPLIKVKDCNCKKMLVEVPRGIRQQYKVRYFNLTCETIDRAIDVYKKLTETPFDPNELPF